MGCFLCLCVGENKSGLCAQKKQKKQRKKRVFYGAFKKIKLFWAKILTKEKRLVIIKNREA